VVQDLDLTLQRPQFFVAALVIPAKSPSNTGL
jgi:hypothetical protein